MIKHTEMNHDAEEMYQVFNLTEEQGNRVKYAIAFESFKGCIMKDELYPDDDVQDAPRILTTKSGCLERCYQHMETLAQKELLLFTFLESHERWIDKYKMYTRLPEKLKEFEQDFKNDSDDMNDFEKEAKLMIIRLMQAKAKDQGRGVKHIIDCIKASKYDFNRFIVLYDGDNEIQDMINKALKKDEDDSDKDSDPLF